jgi:hypothetical protein
LTFGEPSSGFTPGPRSTSKAWDVIAKQTNHFNDGPESKESDPHDGSYSNDKSDGKSLSKYVIPKIVIKMQKWSKDSIQLLGTHTKGVDTHRINAKN